MLNLAQRRFLGASAKKCSYCMKVRYVRSHCLCMNRISLIFALPIVTAFACGGEVFLDSSKTQDAAPDGRTAPQSDGGATSDSGTIDVSCPATPEVIATFTGPLDHVDQLVLNGGYAAFTLSNAAETLPLDPLRRALHALKLDTLADNTLVADNRMVEAMSAPIALLGDAVYYTAPTILPQDGSGPRRVMRVPLAGGTASGVFAAEAGRDYDHIAASTDGVLVGASMPWGAAPPPTALQRAWAWKEGFTTAQDYGHPDTIALRAFDAFEGGAAALHVAENRVYLLLHKRTETKVQLTGSEGRVLRRVRARREAASPFATIYALMGSAAVPNAQHELIYKDPCVTDVNSGQVACAEEASPIVYSVATGTDLVDFALRADNSFVVSQVATDGVRPASKVVWVHDGKADAIGGEGITGTVDEITALATHGKCIYWAERSAAGSRMMRVAR